jgi:hypothetical protein
MCSGIFTQTFNRLESIGTLRLNRPRTASLLMRSGWSIISFCFTARICQLNKSFQDDLLSLMDKTHFHPRGGFVLLLTM